MKNVIAILGEFKPTFPPHPATDAAIDHSRRILGADIVGEWVATDVVDEVVLERASGLWVAPGSPYQNLEKTLAAIRYAREQHLPCFGTCGGFQHMVLEYARNVLGFHDAQHAEYDPYASRLFVSALECTLAGREMALQFVPGSRVAGVYRDSSAIERYYCNFGINPEYRSLLENGPLRVSGVDSEGEVRVIELPDHPFFLGTLFVPQARSTAEEPHPLVTAFLRAAVDANRHNSQRVDAAYQGVFQKPR